MLDKIRQILVVCLATIVYLIIFLIRNIFHLFWVIPLLITLLAIYQHYFPPEKKVTKRSVSQTGSGLCDNYYDRAIDGSLCGNRASKGKPVLNVLPVQANNVAINPELENIITGSSRKESREEIWNREVTLNIPSLNNLLSDQNFLNYVNSKIVDGQTAFELIKTTGENKDISKLPRIRAIIDEYYNQLSANNVKLAFTCSLNDNRNVFVAARDGNYIYTIFDKSGKNIELTFTNTANQIQNNSLLHRNGITLIMQNKTYQYRISNQANKTTIFVYNGDKGVSTHYCQADKTYWDTSQLPVFGNNTGSPNHRKYCRQVINEGLYLAKMSKICPIEMSGLNLRVEDTALFFDAEGCSYLLFESENAQKNMIVNLSNKLNSSIDKKIQKLGSQFCAKESGYARKMAERYTDFFNGR